MSIWEVIAATIGTICFAIWVPCMISWIRRGVSMPRHIHFLAVAMTCVSVGCLVGLTVAGLVTFKLAIALLVLPAPLTYFGWFWMFGPEVSQ